MVTLAFFSYTPRTICLIFQLKRVQSFFLSYVSFIDSHIFIVMIQFVSFYKIAFKVKTSTPFCVTYFTVCNCFLFLYLVWEKKFLFSFKCKVCCMYTAAGKRGSKVHVFPTISGFFSDSRSFFAELRKEMKKKRSCLSLA